MATETITSDPTQTLVGTAGTKLETYTQTTFTRDSNGKIDPKSVKTEILYNNSTIPAVKNWVPAAASTDGGKTWDTTSKRYQKLDGTPVLGSEAQKSLKQGALRTTTNQQIQTAATKAKINSEQTKVLSDAAKNNASDTEKNEAKLTAALSEERKGTRNKFPGASGERPLIYPITLKYENQDVIKFRMVKYSPKKLDQNNKDKDLSPFEGRRKITDEIVIGTAILPIPSGISDSNAVNWSSNETGVFGSQLYNIANAFITGGGEAGSEATGAALEGAQNNTGDLQKGLSNMFAESASGTTNMLSRTKGAVYNPNMELLFNGPSLRPFNFVFRLSARSSKEAEEIRKIIRFFKQGMSPIRTESQLFLKAPHTFQLDYLHNGKPHNYLNRFKECALQSFSVDYTSEGQYATFTDGAMVVYQISMQFQELEPIFNDDYSSLDNNTDTEIGY